MITARTARHDTFDRYIRLLEENPTVQTGNHTVREVVDSCGLGPFSQYLGVVEIQPMKDYKLKCRLKTGETKIFDFTPHLELPMFSHLRDQSKFEDVVIVDDVPTWISAKTGRRDLDMGISWILVDGVDI